MYRADDGEIFSTAEEALRREELIEEIKEIMKSLGEEVEEFNSFKQEDPEIAFQVKKALCEFTFKNIGLSAYYPMPSPEDINPRGAMSFKGGSFLRYMEDSEMFSALRNAWDHAYCVDNDGKKYDQVGSCLQGRAKELLAFRQMRLPKVSSAQKNVIASTVER